MRSASAIVAQTINELRRILELEMLAKVTAGAIGIDEEQRYSSRAVHSFNEDDSFIPEQLAFVVVMGGLPMPV